MPTLKSAQLRTLHTMSKFSPETAPTKTWNWVKSAGINDKKYSPWIGSQLLGVRDQFLIFHPLILLWDLKRIQLFLTKIQTYTNYSFLLIESRESIRAAIQSYLSLNNVPAGYCHVLNFDFPGTLTNQYYMSTQSSSSTIITSKQIMVFFDYFLNRQFYTESLIIPCVRLSLYSLHNLPINMQYGLPAKSGLLIAIRLLLKLLLKPVALCELQVQASAYHRLVKGVPITLPLVSKGISKALQINKTGLRPDVLLNSRDKVQFIKSWHKTQQLALWKKKLQLIKIRQKRRQQKNKSRVIKSFIAYLKRPVKRKKSHNLLTRAHFLVRKPALLAVFQKARTPLSSEKFVRLIRFLKKFQKNTSQRFCKGILLKKRKRNAKQAFTQTRQHPLKRVAFTVDALRAYYNRSIHFKLKHKKLMAKYARTCHIKTQKEWLRMKDKHKARIELIKQRQREKSRPRTNSHRSRSQTKETSNQGRNRPANLKVGSATRKNPAQRHGLRSYSSAIPRRGGTINRRHQLKKARRRAPYRSQYRRYRLAIYYPSVKYLTKLYPVSARKLNPLLSGLWVRTNYYTLRSYNLTAKVRQPYGMSRFALAKLGIPRLTKNLKKITTININRFRTRSLITLSSLHKLYRKTKSPLRIKRFKLWRAAFRRIVRKADRRWLEVQKKKVILRQLHRRLDHVYQSKNRYTGIYSVRKLRFKDFLRPLNWRKWRRKYFRRYVRKEQFHLQLMHKPRLNFTARGVYNTATKLVNKTSVHSPVFNRYIFASSMGCTYKNTGETSRSSSLRPLKKKAFIKARKRWRRAQNKFGNRFGRYTRENACGSRILDPSLKCPRVQLTLFATHEVRGGLNTKKKNYTNQLWFRMYRTSRGLTASGAKAISKRFRQLTRQKQLFLVKRRLYTSYWSSIRLKALLKYKNQRLWNWRIFKNRSRSRDEVKRYVQNFKHSHLKLTKHRGMQLIISKNTRNKAVRALLRAYAKISNRSQDNQKNILSVFKTKPVRLTKVAFLKFGGRLVQNKNILVGFRSIKNLSRPSFLQCYNNRKFWANDNFGPSPLVFWISPKARSAETPAQLELTSALIHFNLSIKLPVFSCLNYLRSRSTQPIESGRKSFMSENLRPETAPLTLLKEIQSIDKSRRTFKFIVSGQHSTSQKEQRWLWYYMQSKYLPASIKWQVCLLSKKQLTSALRTNSARKLFSMHYKIPRKVRSTIAYILRCTKRRRRRLRERTFNGPTRYRRKYRTHYMFNYLVKLNSHRCRHGVPDLTNRVNRYFIRKLVLRRFLRLIYGPKLTNHYFKHFSNLLFIKKFKFWTLYTFFYLRLDFVTILLKFASNLTWSRFLITNGSILVNNSVQKTSYSIFLGDVIRYKKAFLSGSTLPYVEMDHLRNISAYAPRVGNSIKYQTKLRVPNFFEYNARIRAGTMFRLPWYYEVRGKFINKENLLLLARGHHSF